MKKIIIVSALFSLIFSQRPIQNELYEKIDLFGEVLENIKKEYVDDVDQAEVMDSASMVCFNR